MSVPPKSSPKDAQVMSAILKDMGVLESEPRLINQMLEFTYRYVTDVLDDAKVYSNHANRKTVDADDIKLAVQIKTDHSFTNPPPKDLLLEVARQKNSQPLPLIKPYSGPRLPPDRYCLTAPNYKLRTLKKPRSVQYGLPMSQKIGLVSQVKSMVGPNLTVVTKSVSQPTVTILNKVTSTPKPTVRVNPGLGAIGASGLSRIISSGSLTGSLVSAAPAPTVQTSVQPSTPSASVTSVSGISTLPTSLPTPGSATVNPLKRKLEDDDYDI
ncbi:transcription initiation factor tfiid subunit 9 [Plakobranchus ocellatus]|uniref:Transcription initiation factor tfiid subunit 9 n=1 Tax=Plakobranchus ocellatus TaxID=259542 RepID=A0AAV4CVF7_9GAST|nr:transcription initiation factor tfiid subunit 9 [Plakobranchus ocellatus]